MILVNSLNLKPNYYYLKERKKEQMGVHFRFLDVNKIKSFLNAFPNLFKLTNLKLFFYKHFLN